MQALRDQDRAKIKRYFTYLRLFLEAMGYLPEQNRQLWRGVGVDLYDQYPVGSTITWWGVSRCLQAEGWLEEFLNVAPILKFSASTPPLPQLHFGHQRGQVLHERLRRQEDPAHHQCQASMRHLHHHFLLQ